MKFATHSLTGNSEYKTLNQRQYLVAPGTAIVEGVLNGDLVLSNEIEASLGSWNGRPLPILHPQEDGTYVTANRPDIMESAVVGMFFNAKFDADALKGEFWLDTEKMRAIGGLAAQALDMILAGQPVEVSTAYWCTVEERTGKWGDKTYYGVQKNLRPDHIALLPGEIGACNWHDGCGLPRTNRSKPPVTVTSGNADRLVYRADGVVVNNGGNMQEEKTAEQLELVEPAATEPAATEPATEDVAADEPNAANNADVAAELEQVAEAEDATGTEAALENDAPAGDAVEEVANEMVVETDELSVLRAQVADLMACRAQMTDAMQAMRDESAAARAAVDDMNGHTLIRLNSLETDMAEIVGAVKALGGVESLTAAISMANTLGEVGGAEILAVMVNSWDNLRQLMEAWAMWTAEDMRGVFDWNEAVKQAGGPAQVMEQMKTLAANAARAKREMVSNLAARPGVVFTEAELMAMDSDTLEKLDRSLSPNSFAGRGGERTPEAPSVWVPYQAPALVQR